jgi:hypothetical protein
MLNGTSPLFVADSLQIDFIRIYQDSLDQPGPFAISGNIHYANSTQDPIRTGQIILSQNNRWLNDTGLNMDGHFGFYGLLPGSYSLTPEIHQTHGGLNASDALAAALHFAQVQPLQGLSLLAADVNANGTVNANDALSITLRYCGVISSFAAGDWIFSPRPVTLSSAVQNNINISVLATGDVNANYRP